MSDAEEDNPAAFPFKPKDDQYVRTAEDQGEPIMDFDLFLDNSWPLDQITPFISQPLSPILISVSDQSYSPLWAFSDGDGKLARYACSVLGASNLPTEESANNHENEVPNPSALWGLKALENPDSYCLLKGRMTQALRYFKESTELHVLAQIWAPMKDGDRCVLTTSGQPFVLDTQSSGLHQYRMVSLTYMFSLDGKTDGVLGLPGRVFLQKLPEWTPNVQYYSSREYPRLSHALHYNVQGTLALPVFEISGQSCLGVLELIMTSPKINYAPEVDKVCKALEAVNLKSSEILDLPSTQICNEGRQNALAEILEVLTVVCETHNLPLAQTWVPCRHRSVLTHGGGLKRSCTSFDGSCMGQVCMSATDLAFYVVDAHKWGFREACLEHHLQKGQGVPGKAFLSHSSCFCTNITQFCKTVYPLVHYARMFGLKSSFSICLRSTFTGDDEYILEFFLPCHQELNLLGSLFATMKQHFRTLKVASGRIDLNKDEVFVEIIEASMNEGLVSRVEYVRISKPTELHPMPQVVINEGELNLPKEQLLVDFDYQNYGSNAVHENGSLTPVNFNEIRGKRKTSKRNRGKAEKSISLEVLRQYFSGSLKVAAKSLGVCPTTMKRICRQLGISHWPSRKINKVNRSLSKLKNVIESVQGGEGAFGLTSLVTSPLPVTFGSSSHPLQGSNQQNSSSYKPCEPLNKNLISKTHGNKAQPGKAVVNRSKLGSGSGNENSGTQTSHSSCQGSPLNESSLAKHTHISTLQDQCINLGGSLEMQFHQPTDKPNLSASFLDPDALVLLQSNEPFGGMLIEDAGSSKDLRDLICPVAADAGRPEMKTMTIKATHKEDIIRFRVPLSVGTGKLKEEVAKRLKLEVGTFDMKYIDDDQEWVLIACDADMEECLDIFKSSGSNVIRLLIHDLTVNVGRSYESNGGL